MKQLTRQEVEAVVERLADKTLSFGCEVEICVVDKVEKVTINDDSIMANGNPYSADSILYFYDSEVYSINKVLGHPITIGNVLENMKEKGLYCEFLGGESANVNFLMKYWSNCSFSKSLQEIVEASGWKSEYVGREVCEEHNCNYCHCEKYQVLTSPEANALFSFLQEIL